MSKLLFDDQPIVIARELACVIGLNEAIVLQQIHYWLQINKDKNINYFDGKFWTYNSIRRWKEDNFPFWSEKTVERTLQSLEKMDILITANYNKDKRDRSKWYTIDYDNLQQYVDKIKAFSQNDECIKNELDEDGDKTTECNEAELQEQWDKTTEPLPETSKKIPVKNNNNMDKPKGKHRSSKDVVDFPPDMINQVKVIIPDLSDVDANTLLQLVNGNIDELEKNYNYILKCVTEVRGIVGTLIDHFTNPDKYKPKVLINNKVNCKQNGFNNFENRKYDIKQLEQNLL